jgi:two-component system response regulator DctR
MSYSSGPEIVEIKTTIFLVEDDSSLSDALIGMLEAYEFAVLAFEAVDSFLTVALNQEVETKPSQDYMQPAVILLDIRVKGSSGLDVFNALKAKGLLSQWPIIFMTGHGDMETAIRVLKEGAFDFVLKPFESDSLIQKILAAEIQSKRVLEEKLFIRQIEKSLKELTDKEQEVMTRVALGQTNKEIAEHLGNSSRTVEIHRAKVFEKLKVTNAVELSKFLERYRLLQGTSEN